MVVYIIAVSISLITGFIQKNYKNFSLNIFLLPYLLIDTFITYYNNKYLQI